LTDPITRDSALAVLTHAIAIYPHQQLYLLVPWGLAAIDQVIATIDSLAGRGCQPCFIIGDNAYAIEMMFPIEPMSEGDAELRRDPDVIAGSAAFYRPWLGQGR
jgi:hypothetical protein